MNSFATTNANRNIKGQRMLALVAALLVLAACTAPPTRAPTAKPAPVAKPPTSVSVTPASASGLVDPRNYEKEKSRIKQVLAKNSRDSLAAAEVGYYMDVLQGRLKQVVGKTAGSGIGRKADVIVVVLSGRAGFESSNTQINQSIREVLKPLSSVLVEYRMLLVTVRIGVDDSGKRASNPLLNEQRAQAVAAFLAQAGVASKRMVVIGSGLKNTPTTTAGNSERIVLKLEPIVRAAGSVR